MVSTSKLKALVGALAVSFSCAHGARDAPDQTPDIPERLPELTIFEQIEMLRDRLMSPDALVQVVKCLSKEEQQSPVIVCGIPAEKVKIECKPVAPRVRIAYPQSAPSVEMMQRPKFECTEVVRVEDFECMFVRALRSDFEASGALRGYNYKEINAIPHECTSGHAIVYDSPKRGNYLLPYEIYLGE